MSGGADRTRLDMASVYNVPPMRNAVLIIGGLALLVSAGASQVVKPPSSRIENVVDVLHGVPVPDPYRWLEEDSPETRAWLAAQTAYARTLLDAIPGRSRIQQLFEEVQPGGTFPPPIETDGRRFLVNRPTASGDQGYYFQESPTAPGELILVAPRDEQGRLLNLNFMGLSPDRRLLAYGVRRSGSEETEALFFDITTKRPLEDRLPPAIYSRMTFLPDGSGVLYIRRAFTGHRLLLHRFGINPSADLELFGKGLDGSWILQFQCSTDGRFIAAFANQGAGSAAHTQVHLMDRQSGGGFRRILENARDASFQGAFAGHTLFLRTTWNASNGRGISIDAERPEQQPREVLPESPNRVLQSLLLAGRAVVVQVLENVTPQLLIVEPDIPKVDRVALPTLGSLSTTAFGWEQPMMFFTLSSLSGSALYRYDVARRSRAPWSLPAELRKDDIEATETTYVSRDGTRVPMFVFHKKGLARDGTQPTLLSAYGGFGAITLPFGSTEGAAWVRAGGVYAFAAIRGGGELGAAWHNAGRLQRKQNTFDDFIAAAEWLVKERYTRPDRLAAFGHSHAGMVVTVAAIQRPDLFRAVVSSSAHLDMVRYPRFLAAAPWTSEFGSPDVATDFEYLYRYSPYHAVKDGARYPAMMFVAGGADTRVAPLHSRKMTARLQAASGSGWPVILRYDERAGHGGSLGEERTAQRTDEMAFLLSQLGVASSKRDAPHAAAVRKRE